MRYIALALVLFAACDSDFIIATQNALQDAGTDTGRMFGRPGKDAARDATAPGDVNSDDTATTGGTGGSMVAIPLQGGQGGTPGTGGKSPPTERPSFPPSDPRDLGYRSCQTNNQGNRPDVSTACGHHGGDGQWIPRLNPDGIRCSVCLPQFEGCVWWGQVANDPADILWLVCVDNCVNDCAE